MLTSSHFNRTRPTNSYNYNPVEPPLLTDHFEIGQYAQGEAIHNRYEKTKDFFEQRDNTEHDLDSRIGYVELNKTEAAGLIKKETQSVSGTLNPNGNIECVRNE